MSRAANDRIIRGVVRRVTFRNPENGYAVLKVDLPESNEQITVVGTCLNPNVGQNLLIRGDYTVHPRFGKQFQAESIQEVEPSSAEGISKYLASGLIKGVGEKTADKIVAHFGTDALQILKTQPERISEVPGIGRKKAAKIAASVKDNQDLQEVMRFLLEHNISSGLASRIYERYKNRTVEILSRDPYLLARDMRGVGFATADSIAMNLGLEHDSPERLKAGVYYALEKGADDGHCYLTLDTLLVRARTLLGLGEEYDLSGALEALIKEGSVIKDEERIYLRHLYRAEIFVADFIGQRTAPYETPLVSERLIERALTQAQEELNISFSAEQREAALAASRYPFLVVTGGPGCGKTTVIRALSRIFQYAEKRLALTAPTGRAAQRMSQVTGLPASTIHRLLKYDPIKRGFLHGLNKPLAVDAVIVDEASMIDILLARDLFSAIPREATLILVGDKDQLPSVGPGRVFADLIALKEIKTITLNRLFRRAKESTINTIAHMINSGLTPQIPEPDGVTRSDAYFIAKKDPQKACSLIESLVAEQIPKKFKIPSNEIVVLTPTNRGPLGTQVLNQRLQERLNPEGFMNNTAGVKVGHYTLRPGDRVCQRVNNYNIDSYGVFNGDNGIIYSVDPVGKKVVVELWDGRLITYDESNISQLSLAYAITVHRSQGSEIPCVVLALHDSHYTLLERQLIYTAVTRAKKLLIVVGSKRALMLASKRMGSKKRLTALSELVKKRMSIQDVI
ncbi:MAG: ATP-dependent RecD-like DNA helicase [Candidatus Dadabacteria bacterium]|nr:MAG: ATP-dependent RecD-like DNA helicase [Candidatus Dadabacteria bacterium]